MTLWIEVTNDKYELPVAVETCVKDLARKAGVKPDSIISMVSKDRAGKMKKCRFKKVIVEDD